MRKLLLFVLIYSSLAAQDIKFIQDTLQYGKALCLYQHSTRDRNGKLNIVFTSQPSPSINSKDIIFAEQCADSFKFINITSDKTEDNFPNIFIDRNNNTHIAFIGKDSAGLFQVKYTNNVKGKFCEPVFVTSGGLNKSAPVITVSRDIVYFLYYTNSYLENNVFISSFNFIKGKVIQEKLLGYGSTDDNTNVSIATDNKGFVHVVFKAGNKDGGQLKFYNNIQGNFNEQDLGYWENIIYPRILVNRTGMINIIFKNISDNRLYLIKFLDKESSDAIPITPASHNPVNFSNFSLDEHSRVYIIYESDDINSKAYYLVHGKEENFSEPIKLSSARLNSFIENSITMHTSGNGEISATVSEFYKIDGKPGSSMLLFKGYLFGNAQISIKNNFLFFPKVRVGESDTKSFMIQNSGSSDLIISSVFSNNPSFQVIMPDSVVIEPDSLKEFQVTFSPDDTVEYKAELTLFTNATNSASTNLFLKGKGIGIPYILTESDTVIFTESYDSLLVINAGTDKLLIDSLWLPSYVSADTLSYIITPGDSIYLKFVINPDDPDYSSNFIDSLMIYSNDPYDSIKTITIHSPQYSLALNPDEVKKNPNILHQNYPNPFNPITTISFTLTQSAHVKLDIYDALAREIAELVDNDLSAGVHNVVFNGENLATGVYYYKIQVENGDNSVKDYIDVRKMILVK